MNRLYFLTLISLVLGAAVRPFASICHAEDAVKRDSITRLRTEANTETRQQSKVVSVEPSSATSFLVEVALDPTKKPSGDHQTIAGLAIGLPGPDAEAFPGKGRVCFEMREGTTSGFWDVWIDGVNEGQREPSPRPPGWVDNHQYQKPWEFTPHAGSYRLRIIGAPVETGTHLRFYFEHFDRPVFEFTVSRKVVPGHVGFYAVTGGTEPRVNTATFQDLIVREVADSEPLINPSVRDIVLDAIDLEHPDLSDVAKAIERGERQLAGRLLLEHLKSRTKPVGPGFKLEYHGTNYREVADAVLEDRYGTLGPFAKFEETYIDGKGTRQPFVDEKGVIRWDLCHGHLTRHFHWVSLAKAYAETKNEHYAARFSREVQDWVAREPFLHPRNPDIGGLNWMDGTTFKLGYLNTSNIGRRCEMTWWPAYDEFRKSSSFTDEAHFHMLLGFLRQSRLIMNPSSFAAHDDGGAHTCVALLQNALMLPEFKESKRWEQEAVRRWEEVLKVQFHKDGSHVSLSTGYNWASLMAMENMIALFRRVERDVPQKFLDVLELAYQHPIALSRPDQGQIDLNDSSWGMIDDHMRRAHQLFPERDDFLWMATKGEEGKPPEYRSIYFPNAGHIVMRTGWGPQHRYLFMDAGPVGASHGKEDKLNIYVDYGGHQLLASGGRGSYAGGPFAAYTGSTRAYNTVLVDGGVQARTYPRYEIDGHSPEQRRFVIDEHFEYAEGFHTHGWFAPGKHIQGKHTRQLLFVKGHNPPETSYWVVFDTMEPQDENPHEYEALFHIRRNHAEIADPKRKVVHGWDAAASLRILPVTVDGLDVELVHGQTEPHIQGWHVVGNARAPMWTPTFRWKSKGKNSRAWVLVPAGADQKWCVDRVEVEQDNPESLVFRCIRPDGSSDRIYRRSQNNPTSERKGTKLRGDLGAVSINAAGKAVDTFFVTDNAELKEHFGEQQFAPREGFVLKVGQRLPDLVWDDPELVAKVVDNPTIPTRWFNERFEEVQTAEKPGRYYAYGEAPVPSGPALRRAMTCCCLADDVNLEALARKRMESTQLGVADDGALIKSMIHRWNSSEEGAVELAAILDSDKTTEPARVGQWQMENATQHVRLKRKLMGLAHKPIIKATVKPNQGQPAPELRNAPLKEAGITEEQVREIEAKLDEWYADSEEPMAVVIARNGVIVVAKGYGKVDEKPVTIDTPMLLHSAMKPLIGLQLAMYVDQGIIKLDEPIGNYLPDFNSPNDRNLTFRAGHVHATGIHFPWELAFRRLFYFHTWHESLIAHCKREWAPGAKYRYGVVGVILSVRALELLRGRNYWDAMERDLFEPLGIRNVLPGGTGFSAENMARIGVVLANRGKYGDKEVISEETYSAIVPTSLKAYFPALDMQYGIGLQNHSQQLGPGSYGHGGGCGTLLTVNPENHLVFAMVRNGQGKDYKKSRAKVLSLMRKWIDE